MNKDVELIEYWLISIPNQDNEEKTLQTLKSNVEGRGGEFFSLQKKVPIERLKVGTLDKLIALSDDLGRVDASGKNVVQKLHRTYSELEENMESPLSVYNKSARSYIPQFRWDDGHFNPRTQLRDLVQSIHSNMVKTAEHLRKWTSALSEIENAVAAIERKKTGSLMNKALSEYIDYKEWYEGDYLRSALVVVPKAKTADFEAQYEFFEDTPANDAYYQMLHKRAEAQEADHKEEAADQGHMDDDAPSPDHGQEKGGDVEMNKLRAAECRVVVPESAKLLTEDGEFVLYQVLLLERGYQWFKFVTMKNGFAVRDFDINELESGDDEKTLDDLMKKRMQQKKKLKLFCKNTFSETFANWIHLKVIRTFVESVLRFGLPVDFSISVVKPQKGKEVQLLKTLEQRYNFLLDNILKSKSGKDAENEIDYSGQLNDFYPFVYVQAKVELGL